VWLSQSQDQAIPACSLLQRQGINTIDVTLLPPQSAGRRQKVKKMIDTGRELGVMPLSPPFFLVHFCFLFVIGFTDFPQIVPSYKRTWPLGSGTLKTKLLRPYGDTKRSLEIKVRSPASLRRKQPLPPPRVNSVISRNINLLDFPQQLGIS